MEHRSLEITLISARGLKEVNHLSKMDVYVVVTISGDPRTQQKTSVDIDGGTNPAWNFQMKFTIDEALAQMNRLILTFRLKCDRSLRGDKDIGEVHVPVKELLDNAGDGKSAKNVAYQVKIPSGKPKGVLNLSYKFGDKITGATSKVDVPVASYPAHATTTSPYPSPAHPPPMGTERYPPTETGHNQPIATCPPPAGYPLLAPQPPKMHAGYFPQSSPPPPPASATGYEYPPNMQAGNNASAPEQPVEYPTPALATVYAYPPKMKAKYSPPSQGQQMVYSSLVPELPIGYPTPAPKVRYEHPPVMQAGYCPCAPEPPVGYPPVLGGKPPIGYPTPSQATGYKYPPKMQTEDHPPTPEPPVGYPTLTPTTKYEYPQKKQQNSNLQNHRQGILHLLKNCQQATQDLLQQQDMGILRHHQGTGTPNWGQTIGIRLWGIIHNIDCG